MRRRENGVLRYIRGIVRNGSVAPVRRSRAAIGRTLHRGPGPCAIQCERVTSVSPQLCAIVTRISSSFML